MPLTALCFIQNAARPRLTLAMSLMGSLAVYACGTPTGPVVATIELPTTSLSLWTSPAETAISEHEYASPEGAQLSLTLYLPQYGEAVLNATVLDEAGGNVSQTLTWTSSDASVVTVSSRGEGSSVGDVSATGVGSATITASADGVTSNPVTVTVREGTESLPAILYLHSGAWFPNGKPYQGSPTDFQRHAVHMATKGFVGATIQYRLAPTVLDLSPSEEIPGEEAIFPAQVQDSKAAVRWLRAKASTYRIDTDRIGVAGGSAGGSLAAMLGTTPHIAEFEGSGGNPGFSSRVQAVAAFVGLFDFPAMPNVVLGDFSSDIFIEGFLGASYEENPELWAKASPSTYVGPESAPFLFLHGTDDFWVPYQQSVDMMNALKAAGVSAEIFTAEGAGSAFYTIDPWQQPTLEAIEEFFTRILK